MSRLRVTVAAACAVLLTACMAQPVREALPPIAGTPEMHQAQREAMLADKAQWSLQGRVAVSNGRDGGSGRIDWRQDGTHYDVALSAPVTRQSWRLSGDDAGAQLEGLEGGTRIGPGAAELLREATRWEIPVAALSSWARGLRADPRHGPATVHYAADGRLGRIEQAGWIIEYSGWQADATGVELPNRLNASKGEAKVRLIVDRWEAAP